MIDQREIMPSFYLTVYFLQSKLSRLIVLVKLVIYTKIMNLEIWFDCIFQTVFQRHCIIRWRLKSSQFQSSVGFAIQRFSTQLFQISYLQIYQH